jgi:hypothetical protein
MLLELRTPPRERDIRTSKESAVSATWDRDHVADRVELKTNQVGDLAFYEGVPAKV